MATMNVSLPDEMKAWVEEQVATGQFANVSDYIRDVLRREQATMARLQAVVDDALQSGVVGLSTGELFDDITRGNRERTLATAAQIRGEGKKADDAA